MIKFFVLLSVQCVITAACPNVVSRKSWNALESAHVTYLNVPVSLVFLFRTFTSPCVTDAACEEYVRTIQNFHIRERGNTDLTVSFLIGGNGKIYEGRGWLHAGTHSPGYNDKSIGIAYMGNAPNIPTIVQLRALKELLRCGVREEYLSHDYHVYSGHTRQPGLEALK